MSEPATGCCRHCAHKPGFVHALPCGPCSITTAEQFEAAYAARSSVTVAELHRSGRYAELCSCQMPGCDGWTMGSQHEDAISADQAGGPFTGPFPRSFNH